jgi:putative membrane protein
MPSELRLHPATLFFDLLKHLKAFAFPALLVIFGTSRSSGGPDGMFGHLPSNWELWLLVLFVPATLFSIFRYVSFRLVYAPHELVIRSGVIFRNERHIPYSRIQNVDAIQNLFHRLFNVVEVRVETAGGKQEEARLSVLPRSAFDDIRSHVFQQRAPLPAEAATADERRAPLDGAPGETLLHMPLREVLLCGILENKGMVLIGAAWGVGWETGLLDRVFDFMPSSMARGYFRNLAVTIFEEDRIPLTDIGYLAVGIVLFLLVVRTISMLWAFLRLYDFRLTRVQEDLRSEYGLFTKVSATIPIRRVQAITIRSSPLQRWLDRATVSVATAGGVKKEQGGHTREWLAPLIKRPAVPHLMQQIVPGFDIDAINWQPVHPRAFRRAVKPPLILAAIVTLITALTIGQVAISVGTVMLVWALFGTYTYVSNLGWAEADDVVLMRSGWLWQSVTLARVNKIQAVSLHETPFDRRAVMARLRVDTAGAGEFSHRVDVPYLDREVARGLSNRLAAAAASTAFRW